jgi:hypothetical protein
VANTVDGYTLAEAQTALAEWKSAVAALATSQSYQIGQRQLTRVNLVEAREQVKYFAAICTALSGSGTAGVSARRIVPRDL